MGMKRKDKEPSANPEGVPFQVFLPTDEEEKQTVTTITTTSQGTTPPDEANGAKQGTYKLSKREKKALEAAPGFNSNYPWFAVPIVKSHKHQLILPFKFVKEYLPKESMNAEIADSNGTTWNVQYVYKKGRSLLYTGWYSFWSSNELKEGDICAFELIDPNPIKLKVSMMKK